MKSLLETLGVREPYVAAAPKPEGPGQKWTVDTVLASTDAAEEPTEFCT